MYLRRAFLHASLVDVLPWALAAGCLYLACKVEESQVQAKLVVSLAQSAHSGVPESLQRGVLPSAHAWALQGSRPTTRP